MSKDATSGDEEIRHLRSSINDLISLQTLPAIWNGSEPGHIVSTLLDVLVGVLRLNFAYARLSNSINGSPVEFVQLTHRRTPPPQPQEIGRALDCWLTNSSAYAPLTVPNPADDGEVRIVPLRLGLMDEVGVLVAASLRADFPTPAETLLLRVAANQALVALQEARQLHEQKRATDELERRVADRTARLTTANQALRESENKYRTLFDSIDEGFCTIEVLFDENDHPIDYRFLEVNPSFEKQTGIQNARGRRMREIAPRHEEHWFKIYGQIALTGEPVRFENQAAQLHRWYDVYAFRVGEPGERKVATLFNDITERKQSQEAMRAAKARFEGILAIAEDAIISVNSDQNIVLFNQGGEKVFGYAENEVIGKPLDILLPQRFVHTHRGHIEEFAKSLDVSRSMAQRREVFGRRKDGSEFPAEASISKLALGNEVVFTVILRDITERKKAEEKLRRNETHLAEAQGLSKTGSWVWNAKTKENVFWSKELRRIYGFDPETSNVQYAAARERVHPEDGSAFDETFHQALREERDFEMDHRIVLPGGEVKHIHVVGHPVLNGSGELVEYVGTVMDVTEQVQARAALEEAISRIRESETRLRTIIDTIPTLAWSTEANGAAEFLNLRWRNYTGLSTEQAQGWGWQVAIHPEDVGWLSEQWRITTSSGKPCELEARMRRSDGQYRWFMFRADPLIDEQGKVVKWYGTNTDIDDRKRAEEALRKSQAELAHVSRLTTMGELTASIAHEVNQPLTAVVNNANASISLLPKDTPALEEVRQALAEIIDDANRAGDVIARVRQLAKRAPIEKSLLDLRDVVQDVLALARYESAARKVTIRTDLSNDLPSVFGDRVQLQQVLLNLVINGMDAMSEVEESQRVLTICGRRETHAGTFAARLSVEDSGVGFKPEEMNRLFEAFYTTKPQGMGMGLAISRSIIEAQGGRLWAEPNQGPGATFLFSLPAAPENLGVGGRAAGGNPS